MAEQGHGRRVGGIGAELREVPLHRRRRLLVPVLVTVLVTVLITAAAGRVVVEVRPQRRRAEEEGVDDAVQGRLRGAGGEGGLEGGEEGVLAGEVARQRAVADGAVVDLLHQRVVHRLVVLGEGVGEEVLGVALRLAEVAVLAHARKVGVWGLGCVGKVLCVGRGRRVV